MAGWKAWLEAARRDLAAAESLGQAGFYEHACFNCQQAAEKSLKALLLLRKGEFPKIHSLRELATRAGVLGELGNLVAVVDFDYAATRYPDVAAGPVKGLYDAAKFKRHLAAAGRVLELVEEWTKN